jgi:hypothetical protein
MPPLAALGCIWSIGTAHIVRINAYVAGAYSSLSHGSRKLLSVVKLPSAESGRESWPNCATELMRPYAGLIDAWATVATVGSGCLRSIHMAAGAGLAVAGRLVPPHPRAYCGVNALPSAPRWGTPYGPGVRP